MMARRDALIVGHGHHPGQVPDGCDDRCIEPRLGRLVATLRPLRQAFTMRHEAFGYCRRRVCRAMLGSSLVLSRRSRLASDTSAIESCWWRPTTR